MTAMTCRPASLPAARRNGFTIIELLVVVAIIATLIGLMFPLIAMLKNSEKKATTNAQIMKLAIAMQAYADEDPRHFFPTPAANDYLVFDEKTPSTVLTLLTRAGYSVNTQELETVAGPTNKAMMDGWWRPLRYRLDGPRMVAGAVDASSMNGVADCPAGTVVDDWNPKGKEPWAYVWSLGKPGASETADAAQANAGNWIYQKGLKAPP